MVLPDSWTSALFLLIFASVCFVIWPNLFKVAGPKWRFELFSLDFALGSVLLAVLAAYTLGTRGSQLDFSDAMLVAGRRAEVVAAGSGAVFALGNMLYLASIALLGLSNGTLLTFCVFGCSVALLHLGRGQYVTYGGAALLLLIGAICTSAAIRAARPVAKKAPGSIIRPGEHKPSMPVTTKGSIVAVLAGLSFAAVWPVLSSAQTEQFGIGAYGGILMGAVGVVIATVLLNVFFMSISLEGGQISFSSYFSGKPNSHLLGAASGFVWTAGALALYTATTGNAGVSRFHAWLVPFAGAWLAIISGVLFWQKMRLSPTAVMTKWAAAMLFTAGAAVLLLGLRQP